jgi:hypothetical protein
MHLFDVDPDQATIESVSDDGIVQLRLPGGGIRVLAIPLEKVPHYRRLARGDDYLASRAARS